MTVSANGAHPTAYNRLVERLNRFPQGAAPTETLYSILKMLFSEREASLVAQLPIQPFSAQDATRIWDMPPSQARAVLDGLASRALLVDNHHDDGRVLFTLPPPMAGFFEFSMMRVRNDIDQKLLAELYHQYCALEPDFFRHMFEGGETQLGRILINEDVIPPGVAVFDYERASEVIRGAKFIGVSMCYCRHKMQHIDQACDAPMDICLTFDATAEGLARYGHARPVDAAEGLDLLQEAYAHNLVQFGDNARKGVNFICNCCGCCCEALAAARRFAPANPIHTSNYLPEVSAEDCTGCGQCVNVCPVEAMALVSAHNPAKPKQKQARVNADICLGCGVCARVCDTGGITMRARAERVITPLTFAHRVVLAATERGQLQDLIFDRRTLWSHRAMAAVLGAILRLPPVKRTLAQQQLKSRYLEALIDRVNP